MPKIACPACAQPMSSEAVVCPHCGERRTDIEPGFAGKKLSKEEIRAVLRAGGVAEPAPRGMFATLVLPHPRTRGGARTAELALTAVASPLILGGAFVMLLSRRVRRYRNPEEPDGEALPVLAMAGFGGIGLYSLLEIVGVAAGTSLAVIGVGIAALVVRAVIRTRAAG